MAHKRSHGGGSPGINLGLIITPMLDMAFQILAFFIMTYHPSALEGHIAGSLAPPEKVATKGDKNSLDPMQDPLSVSEDDLLPEANDAIQVKITAVGKDQQIGTRLEGQVSQILVKTKQDNAHFEVADGNVEFAVALKRLDQKLKQIARDAGLAMPAEGADQKDKAVIKAAVKIEADSDLRQQYVMAVYDACQKAGFGKLHLVPPPVLKSTILK